MNQHSTQSGPTTTTGAIAESIGGRLIGRRDVAIGSINAIDEAGDGDIAIVTSERYLRRWPQSRAAAAVIDSSLAEHLPDDSRPVILVDHAELAMAALLEHFAPPEPLWEPGVHATAYVDPTADIAPSARIAPRAFIDARCQIGPDAVVHPGAHLYPDVVVGPRTVLHSGVVIRQRCVIGSDVIIHQNANIGADGFGYRPAADGDGLIKMPHIGRVVIEDRVEIGAGTCVDRGKFGDTRIGEGTKIDNLVQIGHNCRIGRNCVIAGGCALAGSVTLEDWVMMGGQAGVLEHVTIARGAKIGGQTGVVRDVEPGASMFGNPAVPSHEALRQAVALRKLPRLIRRLSSRSDSPGETDAPQA